MDVEHVIFSVGQKGAVDALERMVQLGSLAAHVVIFGDHLAATVFTSDTPKRLNAGNRTAIEQAAAEAGRRWYVEELEPVYVSRVSRRVGAYFMAMARENYRPAKVPGYVPALITT